MEFELTSGDPSRLLVGAERLAQQCPVFLNLISKAEQGYYLAGMHESGEQAVSIVDGYDDIDQLLHRLSRAWLEQRAVKLEGIDVQWLGTQADACGLGQPLFTLLERLVKGECPSQLLDEPELGQCQLGLLSNRERQSAG